MNSWQKKLSMALLVLSAGAVLSGCGGSSSPAADSYSPTGPVAAPRLLSSTAHGGGLGWARSDCFTCHPMSKVENVHVRVPKIRGSLVRLAAKVGGEADRACLACHDTNGLDPATTRECLLCHGDNAVAGAKPFTKAGGFAGGHAHTVTNIGGGSTLKDADCIVCHQRPDMDGILELGDLTSFSAVAYTSVTDFCLACHDLDGAAGILPPPLRHPEPPQDPVFPDLGQTFLGTMVGSEAERRATADIHGFRDGSNPATKPADSAGNRNQYRPGYDAAMELACTDCHFVHSSANPYLITETGASASLLGPAEEARQAGVAVTERSFEQLCAVCHTHAAGPFAGNSGVNLQGSLHTTGYVGDCVACHYHGAGYGSNLF